MANPYEIDWQPPLANGVDILMRAMNAKTQRQFAKNQMEREKTRDYYERKKFESDQRKETDEVIKSAQLMREQGDEAGALGLLKRHSIDVTPEMGASTTTPAQVLTPLDVLRQAPQGTEPPPGEPGSPFEGPQAPPAPASPLTLPTPASIMARAYQPTHTGVTVPEEPPATPPVAPPTVGPGQAPGNAVEDLLPMELEPAKTTPGAPTGFLSLRGNGNADLGKLGPTSGKRDTGLGEKYDAIYAQMLHAGASPEHAFGKALIDYEKDQAESARLTRAQNALEGHTTRQDDQQEFLRQMAEKYKLTVEDLKAIAAGHDRARVAAAGSTTSPDLPKVLKSVEEGDPLSETARIAAEAHIPTKAYAPLAGQVVRNAAAGERAGQRREALTATDDRGNVIGTWKDSQAAKIGAKQIESYHRVKERLDVLIKDIEASGSRVLTPNEIQQRLSKAKSVVAALRPFNELSNTAAGQQMEEDIVGAIGSPGHGWLMGANLDIIKRLAAEAEGQHQAQLSTKLRPGGGSHLAPALGGPKRGENPQGAHPSQDPVGTVKQGPDGKDYRKVGPNNWQPVTP